MKKIILSAISLALLASCESLKAGFASLQESLSTTGTGAAAKNVDPSKRSDPDSANWDIAALDTAKDADYLSGVEKDVVLEMNKARSDPKKFAELYIQPRLQYYNGNKFSQPGQITILTQEGAKVVNECIKELSSSKSVNLLTPEKGLTLAAKDHAKDQSKTGATGHDGSDKSTPFTRMERYGGGYKTAGENISYGSTTGRDIVVQLLVDDGVPNRGHRKNIMNKSFTQTGVGFDTHPQYGYVCVITYASGYTSK